MICNAPIETDRLILRTLSDDHANGAYLSWINDPVVVQFLETRSCVLTEHDLRAFIRGCNENSAVLLLGLFLKSSSSHIGNIKLGPIEAVHERADIGIVIGDQRLWGQGYAREAIQALTSFAFEHLPISKLTSGCYVANDGSRRAFINAGWHEEARRRRHVRHSDDWDDVILLACFKDQIETCDNPNRY